jgi:hypothetical protein
MFDGLITGLLVVGVAIGVALCGVVCFLWWVLSHLTIAWV